MNNRENIGGPPQLPRYQCHKKVRAARICGILEDRGILDLAVENSINLSFASVEVTKEWLEQHKPQLGGYYVIYEDGYASYSPAAAFESGYTLIPA
jgi:hypothetical protein